MVTSPATSVPYQLQVDGSSSAIYESGYRDGLHKSVDGGLTWKSIATYSNYFALTPLGTLYTVIGNNTSRSDDGGTTWQVAGPALPTTGFDMPLAADPANSGVVYAWTPSVYAAGGVFGGELYKLPAASASWQTVSETLSGESAPASTNINYTSAFAAAAALPNRLYYAGSAGWDGFAAKIDPTGTRLLYSTYLGGISDDYANAIAVDATGSAYIAGSTASVNFPATTGSFQTTFAGGSPFRDPRVTGYGIIEYPRGTDAFIAKLDPSGAQLLYASYLGSSGVDWGLGITVDSLRNALVSGFTSCLGFPAVADGFVPPVSTFFSPFVSQVAPDGSQLTYSTCFGGTGGVEAAGVALDRKGNAFLTGLGGYNMVLSPTSGTVGSVLFSELQFPNPCDVNKDGLQNAADVQTLINEALGLTMALDDLDGDGAVTVVDVQTVTNAVIGRGCK